jgi:hypothetical protein
MNTTQNTTSGPAYRKFHRAFISACIVLAPLVLAGWFTLCPQYGDPTCPNTSYPEAVFAAFRAANPVLLQIFLLLNLVIPYVYPISYIGLGMVSMRHSAWWSTIGIGFGWIGSIAWGFIADAIFTLNMNIRLGQDASFKVLQKAYISNPMILIVATGWVIGHWGAYVLLGIAHWRARVIPRWASFLIIISGPLMGPIAYGLTIASGINLGILQVLGFAFVCIGSIPAALALLRTSDLSLERNSI